MRRSFVFLLSTLIFTFSFLIFNLGTAHAVPNDGTYYLRSHNEMGGAGTSITSTDYKVTNFTIGEVVGGKPKVSDTGSVCESGGSGVCKVNPGWLYTRTKFVTSGNFLSTDLLSSQSSTTFNSFIYKMTALPTGTTATIQFSRDGSAWYNSAGILGGTDALTAGANTISLSALGWTAGPFYYKVAYTGPGSKTPSLDYVALGFVGLSAGLNPIFNVAATDGQNDYLRYKIKLCTDLDMTANCQTFDQTASQTGWNGQDAVGSTAYKSGSQAYYTPQTSLTPGTTYYWQAWAIDPAGSNAWSAASSIVSFTTNGPPGGPTISSPTSGATGVGATPAITLSAADAASDWLRYKIQLATDVSFSQNLSTFDQTASQTGWSGQNAQTSTAYNSGSTATYTVQSSLISGKRYFVRAYAIDPGGSNQWSSVSAVSSFLRSGISAGACTSQPGGDMYISESCSFTGGSEGVDGGNLTILPGATFTLNANQSIVWNQGQSITIQPGASIAINSSAKLTQNYIYTPSSGSSGYPDPIGFAGAVGVYHMDDATGNTGTSGNQVFDSTGTNNGIANGTTIVSGKYGNARYFNGTSDYINNGTPLSGSGAFTAAAWINPADNTTAWKTVFAEGCTGFDLTIYGGTIKFGRNCGQGNGFYTGPSIAPNEWTHLAIVFNGTTLDLYKNGVKTTGGASTFTHGTTYIGSYNGSSEFFKGSTDEVHIFNRALSQMEIMGLFNPSSSGMQSMYQNTNPDANSYRRRKDISNAAAPIGEWKLDEQTGTGAYLLNTAP